MIGWGAKQALQCVSGSKVSAWMMSMLPTQRRRRHMAVVPGQPSEQTAVLNCARSIHLGICQCVGGGCSNSMFSVTCSASWRGSRTSTGVAAMRPTTAWCQQRCGCMASFQDSCPCQTQSHNTTPMSVLPPQIELRKAWCAITSRLHDRSCGA
jgi:hypothetical protein